MALLPSPKVHPGAIFMDTFQTSVSKLHITTRVQFLRYRHSLSYKHPTFNFAGEALNSETPSHYYLEKRCNLALRNRNKRLSFSSVGNFSQLNAAGRCISSSSWFDRWNEAHKFSGPKKPQVAVNYRNNENISSSELEDSDDDGSSSSTMERIVEKLKKFKYVDNIAVADRKVERVIEKGSIEDIFYVEDGILPNARGGFSEKAPLGDESLFARGEEVRFPWEKRVVKEEEGYSVRRKSRTSLAELTLPEPELRRLRKLALGLKNKMRITGAGVTQQVVETLRERWKKSEVLKLKIEGAPALNMRRMHEILERKTGGLVIWRSGTSVALYRGVSFPLPSQHQKKNIDNNHENGRKPSSRIMEKIEDGISENDDGSAAFPSQVESLSTKEEMNEGNNSPDIQYEYEIDKLLDGLGPRYTDWPGSGPLPVDADLLPGIVPDYQPPFRILPYGVRSTVGRTEGTALRRLARVLPPHFALGRSRHHQGLAAAMIKLWERSSIAKVALKRGVQLTTSERMAEEIKILTGGMLLSRNKDFLVFYRGKDFLSRDVAEALLEKERLAKMLQDEEEQARLKASNIVTPGGKIAAVSSRATGTLEETLDADARWGKRLDDNDKEKVMREAEILRHANLVRKLERKLAFAEKKLMKAEKTLSKVEESLYPADRQADPESISDEERFMFRKLGLRMKAFLLLGRRGVFDGTVENMHLHWKYRELVKIIVKAKSIEQAKSIALSLEAESGGVLVSVDKISKGYAIIVFRGKDYSRPSGLRPKNLLTKRKALARSIELQRREALLNHISTLQKRANQLRAEIEQMAIVEEHGDEALYDKLDSAYRTEDEDNEDEGADTYLQMDDTNSDDEDDMNDSIDVLQPKTNFPYFQDEIEQQEF